MGTVVSIDLRDGFVADGALADATRWLQSVDARFSPFRPDSEVSRVARGVTAVGDASDDLRAVLALCDSVHIRSHGSFDIWRDELDPSALVKGWSIDRVAEMLRQHGAANFAINAGGDVLACGEPEPGRPWRVGIRHPEQGDRVAAVVGARDLAVATSGNYERGVHIRDPATGCAADQLLSLTVVGAALTLADAYSTAAFVMGTAGVEWVAGLGGYDALAITRDHRVVFSHGLEELLIRE